MNGRLENELKLAEEIDDFIKNEPKYVSEWRNALVASGRTNSTIRDYVMKIRRFLRAVDYDLSKQSVLRYFISIKTKTDKNGNIVQTSDSYQQTIWHCLNNFFTFLLSMGYIKENPMEIIETPKNHDLERINENRILLTKEDFAKIIEAAENAQPCVTKKGKVLAYCTKERDIAILSLLMTTGMRESALTTINIKDINFDEHELVVVDKGEKRHKYYLSDKVIENIKKCIEVRNEYFDTETDALFLNRYGERISKQTVTAAVDKYAKEALGFHISPHKIRSGVCSIIYEETKDIELTRRVIGHSNVATTQRYIVTNNDEREKASNFLSSIL